MFTTFTDTSSIILTLGTFAVVALAVFLSELSIAPTIEEKQPLSPEWKEWRTKELREMIDKLKKQENGKQV